MIRIREFTISDNKILYLKIIKAYLSIWYCILHHSNAYYAFHTWSQWVIEDDMIVIVVVGNFVVVDIIVRPANVMQADEKFAPRTCQGAYTDQLADGHDMRISLRRHSSAATH